MSWSAAGRAGRLPAGSPFAGLPVPAEVRVTRQVLAEPGTASDRGDLGAARRRHAAGDAGAAGAGRIVLFHVTANADWSDLPLSGLFVDMLRRLVALSTGVAARRGRRRRSWRRPRRSTGSASLARRRRPRRALTAAEIARSPVSPRHPPGLYGPENGRRALNLSTRLDAAGRGARHRRRARGRSAAPRRSGCSGRGCWRPRWCCWRSTCWCRCWLRGLLRPALRVGAAPPRCCCCSGCRRARKGPNPALETRLAYVRDRRRSARCRLAQRADRAVRVRQPPHRRRARRTGGGGAGAGRLSASIRCSTGRYPPTRRRPRAPPSPR